MGLIDNKTALVKKWFGAEQATSHHLNQSVVTQFIDAYMSCGAYHAITCTKAIPYSFGPLGTHWVKFESEYNNIQDKTYLEMSSTKCRHLSRLLYVKWFISLGYHLSRLHSMNTSKAPENKFLLTVTALWFPILATSQLSHTMHSQYLMKDSHSSSVMASYGCPSWVWRLAEVLPSKLLYAVLYRVMSYSDISRLYGTNLADRPLPLDLLCYTCCTVGLQLGYWFCLRSVTRYISIIRVMSPICTYSPGTWPRSWPFKHDPYKRRAI